MALSTFLGLYFTSPLEVFLILVQLICYLNSYYVSLFLLGPHPFYVILIITFMHSRAFTAWQLANSTHLASGRETEGTQFCRKCGVYICSRDHHCVFTGRCVEKRNYPYFVSYLFYSYLLSAYTLVQIIKEYELLLEYHLIELRVQVIGFSISFLWLWGSSAAHTSSSSQGHCCPVLFVLSSLGFTQWRSWRRWRSQSTLTQRSGECGSAAKAGRLSVILCLFSEGFSIKLQDYGGVWCHHSAALTCLLIFYFWGQQNDGLISSESAFLFVFLRIFNKNLPSIYFNNDPRWWDPEDCPRCNFLVYPQNPASNPSIPSPQFKA